MNAIQLALSIEDFERRRGRKPDCIKLSIKQWKSLYKEIQDMLVYSNALQARTGASKKLFGIPVRIVENGKEWYGN